MAPGSASAQAAESAQQTHADDRPRVGFYPVLDREGGGVYQYSSTMQHALDSMRNEIDPVIVHDRVWGDSPPSDFTGAWEVLSFGPPTPRVVVYAALSRTLGGHVTANVTNAIRRTLVRLKPLGVGPTGPPSANLGHPRRGTERWLRERGLSLMVYPAPTSYSYECGLPFVMAVHDLQHRIHPEFPEVSADGERQAREHLYTSAARSAQAILVDSEVGREDMLESYGELIDPERVRVLPFVPPPYLVRPQAHEIARVRVSFGIPERYLLLPAQFWPHKNHVRVVEALAALHDEGRDVELVMTGATSGPIRSEVYAKVLATLRDHRIEHLVHIVGYVDEDVMACLYAGAAGLVLPTFFGPTNIPVIEAWAMGVPVLTSDIRGIREQCGDAAILVDPTSTDAIAAGMWSLWDDEPSRAELVAAGSKRVARNRMKDFTSELGTILRDVSAGLQAHQGREAV